MDCVIAVDRVFADCPALHVSGAAVKLLENGNPFLPAQTTEGITYAAGEQVRIYFPDGSFAGIYAYAPERKQYKPVKMFLEKE